MHNNEESKALTVEELDQSCKDNGLTSLVCEQGFMETLEDVLADNPEMDRDSDDTKVCAMERMLEENLNYGPLSDEFDTDLDRPGRMSARWDIIETVAVAWVFGKCKGLADAQKLCSSLIKSGRAA